LAVLDKTYKSNARGLAIISTMSLTLWKIQILNLLQCHRHPIYNGKSMGSGFVVCLKEVSKTKSNTYIIWSICWKFTQLCF